MASNSSPNPQWFFGDDPALSQQSKDGLKQVMQYLWSLRNGQVNLSTTVQNLNTSVTQQITTLSGQVANMANNSNATATPAVFFGSHAQRLTGAFAANLFPGYFYIETDRNFALYYSNGVQWVLIEATSSGSFESRYTGLGPFDTGFNWYETSRNNFTATPPLPYYQWNGANWNLISGEWSRNQSDVSALSATFGANNSNDVGALVNVTDFAGQLLWQNNNTFTWGPDDCRMHGMGPIAAEVDPSPTTGWHLYDGSNNVTYLQSNGNVGTVATLPAISGANASGNTFLAGGNVNSGINPASAPAFTGNAASGSVTANFTGDPQNFNTANFTPLPAGNAALISPTSITPTGNITAAFTGNNVTGTVSNNGTPQNLVRRFWFRR